MTQILQCDTCDKDSSQVGVLPRGKWYRVTEPVTPSPDQQGFVRETLDFCSRECLVGHYSGK